MHSSIEMGVGRVSAKLTGTAELGHDMVHRQL